MVETLRDRLVPSLLDRLTDAEPHKKTEHVSQRVMSVSELRASVLRDLSWLFNTARLEQHGDLSTYPHVKRSVINYGMPALSGCFISGIDLRALESEFHDAILTFEPRLIPSSVVVTAKSQKNDVTHNVISFSIKAQLWAEPAPVELTLMTDVDLENGQCQVFESSARR